MANTKEIQDRIKSINDTLKITNAMYMISSSKLKKSKKMLSDTEPYFFTLQSEMSRILRHIPDISSIYFKTNEDKDAADKKVGYIVITADKGLAGSYNHNVLKIAQEQLGISFTEETTKELSAENKILLAEYFLDFAMQASNYALLMSLEAIHAQNDQPTQNP